MCQLDHVFCLSSQWMISGVCFLQQPIGFNVPSLTAAHSSTTGVSRVSHQTSWGIFYAEKLKWILIFLIVMWFILKIKMKASGCKISTGGSRQTTLVGVGFSVGVDINFATFGHKVTTIVKLCMLSVRELYLRYIIYKKL